MVLSVIERFTAKYNISSDLTFQGTPCWLWTGCLQDGYGRITAHGIMRQAHR